MNEAEFRKKLEEYFCSTSNPKRCETSWWLSLKEFSNYKFRKCHEAEVATKKANNGKA